MSFLTQLAKFDSSLQRGLDNAFAFLLGGRVVPAEIEELLKQQATDNLVVTEDDHVIAPNVYTVGVSSRDLEHLSRDRDLPDGFADQMSRFIRNQGWEFVGSPVIRIAEESGLRTGQLRVSSYITPEPELSSGFDAIDTDLAPEDTGSARPAPPPVASPAPPAAAPPAQPAAPAQPAPVQQVPSAQPAPAAPPPVPVPVPVPSPAPPSANVPEEADMTEIFNNDRSTSSRNATITPAVSLLLQDGSSRTHHLQEGSTILGRSNSADFRLPDTGVSREHAEITWDGRDAVLVDLESTNGTTVNGTPIDNWLLGDGDVIAIGHSNIEVRISTPDNA